MHIYLPVAEISMDGFALIALGLVVGFLSGMFGVGGGFVMTPMLVFIGVPPAIAVGSQSCQLIGTSISGVLAHWQKRQIDLRMGLTLIAGSLVGTTGGVILFRALKESGHIDLVVQLGYLMLLGSVGSLMLWESVNSLRRNYHATPDLPERAPWGANWPLKMRFPASRLYISVLAPILIGMTCGLLVGMFGVGGGFILVPAMLYLLGVPPAYVNGTSLFQTVFAAMLATYLQATMTHSVDVVLAFFVLIGSVVGAQIGTRCAWRLPPELARFLLASLILLVACKLLYDLAMPPASLFSHEMRFP
jgi:uncharacterized membrane protein YfcA